jgi:hypothetical protein
MKPVPGICDRCGQRYPLYRLKFEYILGKNTGLRTCPKCHDLSHPQLDTRRVQTNDKQSVPQSRPDSPEHVTGRAIWSWDPVGAQATGYVEVGNGIVTVTTT